MDPYDRAIYKFRPRSTAEPSYSWYPKKSVPQKGRLPDFQHQLSCYSKTGLYPSDFIVSPEWVSEEFNQPLPFLGRRYRPWPFEYHGARYWPHGTVENKLDEERNIKALVTPREIPSEFTPVEGHERQYLTPSVRMHTTSKNVPWRPKTSWSGYIVNEEAGVFGDSKNGNIRPSSGHVSFSRHVKDMQYYKGADQFQEYFDHNSPYHSHHPDDVGLTSPAHATNPPLKYAHTEEEKSKALTLHPDVPYGKRPKFERPFMNMANAMWIGTKYTTSPGKN